MNKRETQCSVPALSVFVWKR
uniref:Uncharacterized protein n=1 Tax=Anguilla anguilla TaxID=7936 RepID=A0A0E9UT81_ANGAN